MARNAAKVNWRLFVVDLPSFFLRFARDKCGEDEIASVRESPGRRYPDRDDFAVADWPPFDCAECESFQSVVGARVNFGRR